MKTQTGRLANPRRRKPAKRKAAKRRKVSAVAAPRRRRRRANPGIVPRVAATRKTNPARRRRRKAASGGGFLLTGRGQVAKRRPNPSGGMVIGGVHIGETAMMVISGGAAAFAGLIATRFVNDKIRNKWPRVLTKLGAAFAVGLVGMKASESEAMGGMLVLPMAIGFGAPMFASAIEDVFDMDSAGASNKAKTATDAAAEDDDDDMEGIDPDDDIDADIDALDDDEEEDEPMNGFMPQRQLAANTFGATNRGGMSASVRTSPASRIPMVVPNFMQGMGMGFPMKGD